MTISSYFDRKNCLIIIIIWLKIKIRHLHDALKVTLAMTIAKDVVQSFSSILNSVRVGYGHTLSEEWTNVGV